MTSPPFITEPLNFHPPIIRWTESRTICTEQRSCLVINSATFISMNRCRPFRPSGFIQFDRVSFGWQKHDLAFGSHHPINEWRLSAEQTCPVDIALHRRHFVGIVTSGNEQICSIGCPAVYSNFQGGSQPSSRVTSRLGRPTSSFSAAAVIGTSAFFIASNAGQGVKTFFSVHV